MFIQIIGYTFAQYLLYMKRDNTGLIVIRPQKKNKHLKGELQKLADKSTSPSLNNFLEIHLLKLIKNKI